MHSDVQAAESARAVNARAYTVGQDVVFGTGQYAPGMSEGRRLLAHELTHVVQQQNSGEKIRHVLQRTPGDAVRALNIAVGEWDNTVREFPPCSNRGPNAEVDKYLGGRRGRGTVVHNGIRYQCGQPWCAYFVKWCLNQAGISNGVGGAAVSVRNWGQRMGWYHRISSGLRPIRGDIFFKQPSPPSSHPCDDTRHPCISAGGSGHAGFVLGDWGSFVTTIEGNVHAGTNNDGVSSKARPLSQLEGVVRIP